MTWNPPFIRSPYNYDLDAASDETAYRETSKSLTVQSMTEDADLNVMMARFGVTGKMPENVRLPQYGDFSHITDFQSAMNAVTEAEEEFMSLPASVRARFENNPQLLLDFCENPANISEVKKLFGEQNVRSVASDGKGQEGGSAPAGDSVAPSAPAAGGAGKV